MLIGAIVATAMAFGFRLGIWSYAHQATMLSRKGIDPDVMPDRRVGIATSRAFMWFFAVLAVVFWIDGLLGLLL